MKFSLDLEVRMADIYNMLGVGNSRYSMLFNNKIELVAAKEFCEIFGYKISTIYDWKYRPKKNKIPEDLFVKLRRKLHLRTDVLRAMILSQNPLLEIRD